MNNWELNWVSASSLNISCTCVMMTICQNWILTLFWCADLNELLFKNSKTCGFWFLNDGSWVWTMVCCVDEDVLHSNRNHSVPKFVDLKNGNFSFSTCFRLKSSNNSSHEHFGKKWTVVDDMQFVFSRQKHLTCRFIRSVSSHEATIGDRSVSVEHNRHCVAGGTHLSSCWYRTTEPLEAWSICSQPIQYLRPSISHIIWLIWEWFRIISSYLI